jgi:hypothetical protein
MLIVGALLQQYKLKIGGSYFSSKKRNGLPLEKIEIRLSKFPNCTDVLLLPIFGNFA